MSLKQKLTCESLPQVLQPQFLPDYNFKTFVNQVESVLDASSICYQEVQQLKFDITQKFFNGTTLYQSWGSSPGFSDVQNLNQSFLKNVQPWELNSVGASSYHDGNKFGGTSGSRQSCYSSYMMSNSTKLSGHLQPTYCAIYYNIYKNEYDVIPSQGFCLPNSCALELKNLNAWVPQEWTYFDPTSNLTCDLFTGSRVRCEPPRNEYPVKAVTDNFSWAGLGIFLTLTSFVVIQTILRLILTKTKAKYFPFSLQESWTEITSSKQSSKDLKCLHGLKVISQWWVCCRHLLLGAVSILTANYQYQTREWPKYYNYWILESGMLAVDTFYTVGGLLTGYIMLSKFHKFWAQVDSIETFTTLKKWLLYI